MAEAKRTKEAQCWVKPEGAVGARPSDHIGLGGPDELGLFKAVVFHWERGGMEEGQPFQEPFGNVCKYFWLPQFGEVGRVLLAPSAPSLLNIVQCTGCPYPKQRMTRPNMSIVLRFSSKRRRLLGIISREWRVM